ncbi:MAG: exodeoxyribonuclease V subunit gamma, partial [Solirubrobacteraceae bacterium]|nr:exodeoxyribonuclease V subunit gamma [Solirubrobacteraceae bacterium]
MPLTLVTGPANSEKAGAVLDGFRKAIDDGALLVVPTFPDVERLRLQLAEEGLVFGLRVERFAGLFEEIVRRTGTRGRALGATARLRVVAAAVADAPLDVLADAAATPGFTRALARLVDELTELRITPQRFFQALRAWGGEDASRTAYGEELAGLYSAYVRRLERVGRPDPVTRRLAALDALRRDPVRWGGTPVFLYGFDDLTELERDALESLGRATDVTVSLNFEAGRGAFAGRARTVAELVPVVDRHRELPPRAEHYAEGSREALHHLERRLFEPPDGALFETVAAGGAVELLEGGGERAELELVAERISRLLREDGLAPDEIAVVLRSVEDSAALVEQVFAAAGVPVAIDRQVPFGRLPIGRAVLALLRAALLDGTAGDLLTWLRSPGLVRTAGWVDDVERIARLTGARTAADARVIWEAQPRHWPLEALDRVAAAADAGGAELPRRVAAELTALLAAPYRDTEPEGDPGGRPGPVLGPEEAVDAAAVTTARRALEELAALADRDGSLACSAHDVIALLSDLKVRITSRAAGGAVAVTDPLTIRARRVRALFACRLQEGVVPRPARPDALLGDSERQEIALASSLVLRRRADELDAERYLFYATVSRPEELLVLSWHIADDGGDPAVRSFFVDDVVDLFADDLDARIVRRPLGAVGWEGEDAGPPARDALRRAALEAPRRMEPPLAPLRDPAVLGALAGRPAWSASQLEVFASCPVKWFVERGLRPEGLEPDPEAMAKGALAHAALEAMVHGLEGDTRLTPERLPELRRLVRDALAELAGRHQLSTDPARTRAIAHRLERDLIRYVEHAVSTSSPLVPRRTEVAFGGADDDLPAYTLSEGVAITGRIDRVDVTPDGRAIVVDYKGKTATAHAKWVD